MAMMDSAIAKISQIYSEVTEKISDCLNNGIGSNYCIGSYLGNKDIYASEDGLILSLASLANEEGWVKLAYPATISLEAACHEGFSFLLKDMNNHYFELFCMLEENIPEYIAELINDEVHNNEELYVNTFNSTHNVHIPLSSINIAYSGYVEYDGESHYTVEEVMNMYDLSEDEAKDFVNHCNHLSALKELFV